MNVTQTEGLQHRRFKLLLQESGGFAVPLMSAGWVGKKGFWSSKRRVAYFWSLRRNLWSDRV